MFKTLTIIIAVVATLGILMTGAFGQSISWKVANQATFEWQAVTTMNEGDPMLPTDVVTYQPWAKKSDGTNIMKIGAPTNAPTATLTFTQEGSFFVGVSTIRTVADGNKIESIVSWSDNPLVVTNNSVFGYKFYYLPDQTMLIN